MKRHRSAMAAFALSSLWSAGAAFAEPDSTPSPGTPPNPNPKSATASGPASTIPANPHSESDSSPNPDGAGKTRSALAKKKPSALKDGKDNGTSAPPQN